MKIHFFKYIVFLLALIGSIQISYGQSLVEDSETLSGNEIRLFLEELYDSWSSMDVEKIIEKQLSSYEQGFGFRTPNLRIDENIATREQLKTRLERFFNTKEYYNIYIEEMEVFVHGNTGVAWGVHIEDFQQKGSMPEKISVRFSMTFLKTGTGELITILNHRDNQRFNEDGRYFPIF